jgi:hypothetical protein
MSVYVYNSPAAVIHIPIERCTVYLIPLDSSPYYVHSSITTLIMLVSRKFSIFLPYTSACQQKPDLSTNYAGFSNVLDISPIYQRMPAETRYWLMTAIPSYRRSTGNN